MRNIFRRSPKSPKFANTPVVIKTHKPPIPPVPYAPGYTTWSVPAKKKPSHEPNWLNPYAGYTPWGGPWNG